MNQCEDDQKADDCKSDIGGREAAQTYDRRVILDDDAGVLHADEGNEQTDSGGNAVLQVGRDAVDDGFTSLEEGKDDEDDTFHQNCGQCDGESICFSAKLTQADCVCEVCIQTKTCGKGDRVVCQECHDECGKCGSKCSCNKDTASIHDSTQNVGVDGQNISHRQECGETGNDLRADSRAVLFELEQFF